MGGDARPFGITVISSTLALVGLLTGVAGIAVSQLTTMWGADYEGVYAGVGILVGAALVGAATVLWAGAVPAWVVIGLASSFPLMCVVGAPTSSDLATMVPFAVVGWLALWWLLRRPGIVSWLRSRDNGARHSGGDSWL